MGAALERDERVLTGESGGSRHLRKGISCHEDLDKHPGHDTRPLIRDLRLHRVDPPLTCLGLGHFKGNICCPGLAIAHLPLRAPAYLEWFLHLPSLDAVVAVIGPCAASHSVTESRRSPVMTTRGRGSFRCSTHRARSPRRERR